MAHAAEELDDRERAVLDFEAGWWLQCGTKSKGATIREQLGISPASFYATLDGLIDSPAAVASHPLVVARLRRRRSVRRRQRFEGGEPVRRSP